MGDNETKQSQVGADEPGTVTIPEVEIRPYPTIKKGDRGPTVAKWQRMIGVEADGNFGSGTDAATKKFQSAHGLTPDGVVGVKTWAEALKNTSPTGMLALEWNQPSPEIPAAPAASDVIPPTPGAVPLNAGGAGSFTVPAAKSPTASVPSVKFATTPAVQESSMLGDLGKLPWWAKLLGLFGVGYGIYYTSEQNKKHHR